MTEEERERLAKISIYSDGSGNALERYDSAQRRIADQRVVLDKVQRFVEKYFDELAGACWSPDHLINPCVSIIPGLYRHRPTTAKDLARLWPDATWKRARDPYLRKELEYHAVVDGVTIRIEHAEGRREEPAKLPGEGTLVVLDDPAENAGEEA